jgi:ABC-type nitrate/sulfonate/bicarbonate transport system substrate-binding protein
MTARWAIAAGALAACAVATLAGAAPLRVMGFGGASNWALFAAQARGDFRREGLEVEILSARDSASQMRDLMEGRIDVAFTALDNVIAYRDGEAEAPAAADRDIVAILGANHGARFNLLAQPRFAGLRDLRGARIGVDSVSTGYAFVVEELLARAGLGPGDYRLVSVGGSRGRWKALREGKVDAALLNPPLDATAQAAGFRAIASAAEVAARYQGSVAAVRRAWAREHADALVRFVRAYVAAAQWLYAPANAAEAKAILRAREERMGAQEADRSYEETLDPVHGTLSRAGAIDEEGMRAVIRLRATHARPKREPGPAERYYDPQYYRRALGGGPAQ